MVEHVTFNDGVPGSSPGWITIMKKIYIGANVQVKDSVKPVKYCNIGGERNTTVRNGVVYAIGSDWASGCPMDDDHCLVHYKNKQGASGVAAPYELEVETCKS